MGIDVTEADFFAASGLSLMVDRRAGTVVLDTESVADEEDAATFFGVVGDSEGLPAPAFLVPRGDGGGGASAASLVAVVSLCQNSNKLLRPFAVAFADRVLPKFFSRPPKVFDRSLVETTDSRPSPFSQASNARLAASLSKFGGGDPGVLAPEVASPFNQASNTLLITSLLSCFSASFPFSLSESLLFLFPFPFSFSLSSLSESLLLRFSFSLSFSFSFSLSFFSSFANSSLMGKAGVGVREVARFFFVGGDAEGGVVDVGVKS